jgi:L1 cell adhesion molecule
MCVFLCRMYKAAANVCMLCHEECNSTCHGPGPGNCTGCKHVKDGPFCIPVCPTSKYDAGGECQPCHENCVDGCKGPENTIGLNGCNSCERAIINGDVNVVSSQNHHHHHHWLYNSVRILASLMLSECPC